MQLKFSPPLGEIIPLIVRSGMPTATLFFKATFDSPASYEHAQREGTRVEMWTDLPVEGRAQGEWGALPFSLYGPPAANADDGHTVLSLLSADQDAVADSEEPAAYARLSVRFGEYAPGHSWSFTYRLVYASGDICWLGGFGQNGTVCVEHKSSPAILGIDLGEEWMAQDDGAAIFESGLSGQRDIGKLLHHDSWSAWAIREDSWPVFSNSIEISRCRALVLMSRSRGHSVVAHSPVLLSASPGASVGVTSTGKIVYSSTTEAARLTIRVIDKEDHVTLSDCDILLGGGLEPGSATVVAHRATAVEPPLSILILPSHNCRRRVSFDIKTLGLTSLNCHSSSLVVSASDKDNYLTVSDRDVVTVRVGAFGGVALVAPVYTLVRSEGAAGGDCKVSILEAHAMARVTQIQEDMPQRSLPTPPPSPPAAMRIIQHALGGVAILRSAEGSETDNNPTPSTTASLHQVISSVSPTRLNPPILPPVTHLKKQADVLAIQHMPNVFALRALFAIFAWAWHVILQQFAILRRGVTGSQVPEYKVAGHAHGDGEKDNVGDLGDLTTEASANEVHTHNADYEVEQYQNDGAGIDAAIEETTSMSSLIVQPQPKDPFSNARTPRFLPTLESNVRSREGRAPLLIQLPQESSMRNDCLRFAVNGRHVSEPEIIPMHDGYYLVYIDLPVGCESKLTVTLV